MIRARRHRASRAAGVVVEHRADLTPTMERPMTEADHMATTRLRWPPLRDGVIQGPPRPPKPPKGSKAAAGGRMNP